MIYGVLGGTFDPPHLGHLQMLHIVHNCGLIDKILVVPCFAHAFGKQPEGFVDRVAMCELLTDEIDYAQVCDVEKKMKNPGRTLELIHLLMEMFPDDQFRLIAGADIYFERDKWYKFEEIEKLAPLIYLRRKGINIDFKDQTAHFLDAPVNVSSSDLRERLKSGSNNIDGLILPTVMKYIYEHKLYGVK